MCTKEAEAKLRSGCTDHRLETGSVEIQPHPAFLLVSAAMYNVAGLTGGKSAITSDWMTRSKP
jgi:hypothetical protein